MVLFRMKKQYDSIALFMMVLVSFVSVISRRWFPMRTVFASLVVTAFFTGGVVLECYEERI